MANKPLQSIQFPGLPGKYTVPQMDSNFDGISGKVPDSKKVHDEIDSLKEDLNVYADAQTIKSNFTNTVIVGSYWATNGTQALTDSKRARTNPISATNRYGIGVKNDTYKYKVGINAESAGVATWLNDDYASAFTFFPEDTIDFIINIKRSDNADIAQSEIDTIKNSLVNVQLTDKTLTLPNRSADAYAVGARLDGVVTDFNNRLKPFFGDPFDADIIEGGIYSSNPDGTKNFKRFNNAASAIFNSTTGKSYAIKVNNFENTVFRLYGRKDVVSAEDVTENNMVVSVIYEAETPIKEYVVDAGEYQTIFVYLSGSKKPADGISVSITQISVAEIDDTTAVKGKTWSSEKIKSMMNDNSFSYKSIDTEQGCADEVTANYEQFLNMTYEPLRASNPNYITRSVIGKDASGLYDIYKYEFTPDYYDQIIYVQAGVHPWEPDGYVALYRVLKQICDDWEGDKDLTYLRWGVKIVCVPVVNVWGTYQPLGDRTDQNYNGVDLNTDCIAKTQAETIAVTGVIDALADNPLFSFGIDYHTTFNWNYGDYLLTVWTGSLNEFIAKQVLYMLDRKNCTERTQAYLTEFNLQPTELRIIRAGDSTAVRTYCAYIRDKGFPSATVEHSDNVWGEKHSSVAMTKAVENYMNQLINHVNGKYCRIISG